MNKPPRWHKDAPAPKRPDRPARPLWLSPAPAADKPPSRAHAKPAKPAKPAKYKDEPKDPTRCIAAGGRMRCLDCRCGLPSPNNVTIEKMPDYGTKSVHGGKRKPAYRESSNAGLLRMINRKRELMGEDYEDDY